MIASPRSRSSAWHRFVLLAPFLLVLFALLAFPAAGWATWSVIAVDRATGQVVIASATCVSQERLIRPPAEGLMEIQAIVLPGVGVAAAQAAVDPTQENHRLIRREMERGTDPARILEMLKEDPRIESRQFGILDCAGRAATFSGSANGETSLAAHGQVPGTEIHFAIQGNILASEAVVHDAVAAFLAVGGELTDRVMAAMEAADAAGGDRRCNCRTEPVLEAPCHGKTSHVAYILAADPDDPPGEGINDGDYALFIDVHDQNIRPDENANPVITLRMRYDAWKAGTR